MIAALRNLYQTVKTALFGTPVEVATVPEETASRLEIPVVADPEKPALIVTPETGTPAPLLSTESAIVSDEWSVRTYIDPVFVKIGRVYMDAGALVLRSDLDARGFVIPEEELNEALTGGIGEVLLLDQTTTVGFARFSQSGLAMNIVIDQQLHTVPMRSLTPVLTGHHHKAPLFVPSEDVAPD